MKILAALIIMAGAAHADIPAGWSTNVSDAAFKARPGLVFFTASWCGPCKMMTHTTLMDAGVKQVIDGINHMAVDIDEHPELAAEYNVEAVPTFIVLSSGGVEVERTTGYQASADFLKWLNTSLDEARQMTERRTKAKLALSLVDDLMVASGTDSMEKAAEKLFPLCDERDADIAKSAEDRLKAIAEHNPGALLEGLNDGELATRIRVANALEGKLAVEVDPWSDAAARAKAVEKARVGLTNAAGK